MVDLPAEHPQSAQITAMRVTAAQRCTQRLPEPDSPTNATVFPAGTSKLKFFSTWG
jgi:hypothetical protein